MSRKATIIRSRIAEVATINNDESNEYLDKVADFMAGLELKLFTSSKKTVIPLSVQKRKFKPAVAPKYQRKEVIQYDLNMNEVNRYPSLRAVPNSTPSGVGQSCRGLIKKHRGFIYRYAEDVINGKRLPDHQS